MGAFEGIPGILVGHATDPEALTGCTVVLCLGGATGGVDQRGGAPGTRETDLLRPMHLVEQVHAVLLTGGSAFGLAAADGVMRYVAERGVGYPAGPILVPIVPAAVLFDMLIGDPHVRPNADMGYAACVAAQANNPADGNVGAGAGCTVGKVLGLPNATKAGLGFAQRQLAGGLVVGAIAAVNALGDVVDRAGRIVAGTRRPHSTGFAGSLAVLDMLGERAPPLGVSNTVIGVVVTNARLTKEQANLVAQMAHDGVARAIRPAHTMYDGDTIFALATSILSADANLVGAHAAEVMADAIVRGATAATAAGGLPASAGVLAGMGTD